MLLWGAGLAGISRATVQPLACGGVAAAPPMPAPTFDGTATALKVTLPPALPDAHYRLCVPWRGNETAACIKLNAPDLWWRRGDVNLSHATAGTGFVRIFGRNFGNMSPAEPSRLPPVALQLCPGAGPCGQGEITTVNAANGSRNDALFQLPGSLTIGIYHLSLSQCGVVFPLANPDGSPLTIHISSSGTPKGTWADARSQRIIHANTTAQLFAALNTSEGEGGGVILLGRGTYTFTNETVSLPPFTVLRGAVNSAGASLVTLRWDVRQLSAAATPAFFLGGLYTFAIEDVTIYSLGLYNNIIKDSHASSYVRIARVCIRADYFLRWGRAESAYANGSYSTLFNHGS